MDAGDAPSTVLLMVSSGRREPPNSVAVEELSIGPAEKLNSDGEGKPSPTNPLELLSLSARYAEWPVGAET